METNIIVSTFQTISFLGHFLPMEIYAVGLRLSGMYLSYCLVASSNNSGFWMVVTCHRIMYCSWRPQITTRVSQNVLLSPGLMHF